MINSPNAKPKFNAVPDQSSELVVHNAERMGPIIQPRGENCIIVLDVGK